MLGWYWPIEEDNSDGSRCQTKNFSSSTLVICFQSVTLRQKLRKVRFQASPAGCELGLLILSIVELLWHWQFRLLLIKRFAEVCHHHKYEALAHAGNPGLLQRKTREYVVLRGENVRRSTIHWPKKKYFLPSLNNRSV